MAELDVKVVVAICAASATVIAAIIAGAWSFWSLNRQKFLESKNKQMEEQAKIYAGLIIALQNLMNARDEDDHFPSFQRGCVEIYLRGDEKTAEKVFEYFNALVNSTNEGNPLDAATHEQFQSDIINCMRAAQGLKKIKGAHLVRFHQGH
ncbi:hypothetical protein ACTVPS_02145 [Serratia marcescens]|uniref:hypothetical protein n=1 Tax=Serratia marcescens TaxID=615 RepID=UPI003FA6EAC5